jgi:hypothetical protein
MDRAQTISSDDDSSLSSPLTTSNGGSAVSFLSQTPRQEQSTQYEGSLLALPLSAIPQHSLMPPRASSKSILVARYLHSEENIHMNAMEDKEEVGGPETPKTSMSPMF